MTRDDAGSDTPPEEETGQDVPDPLSAGAASSPPPKRFRAADEDEMPLQHYMVSDDRTAATVTLRHGSIGTESGDARLIGQAIAKLAITLREAAKLYSGGVAALADPLLRGLAFGQSVTLEFAISEVEEVQMSLDGVRHSPTLDAARAVRDLVAAEPSQLRDRGVRLGPNIVGPYKGFLNVLAGDSVEMELWVPDVPWVVVITSDHARRDAAILIHEGERTTQRLTVTGTLTMADSELKQFKLTLPADVDRPPLLKGKHRVGGTYSDEIGQKLKEANLWDSEVTATIEATYEVPNTTALPHETTFRLVDAEALIPPQALFT